MYIFLLLANFTLFAQNAKTYDTCSNINRFEGNWINISGNDTIRMCLRKVRVYNADIDMVSDLIFGWHEYKIGNVVVESKYGNRFMPIAYNDTSSINSVSISIGQNTDSCGYLIKTGYGSIVDYAQNMEIHSIKVEINIANNQIFWKQEHREGYGFITGSTGMTLPKQFILTRQ